MWFPRRPRALGSSEAASCRWDGPTPQARCRPAPSRPRLLLPGVGRRPSPGLWKEQLTKAQAAGDSTLIGYLAHPWLTPSQFQKARGGSGSVPQDQSWGFQVGPSQI